MTVSSTFRNVFHYIDIFGQKTEFQIDKNSKFKTTSGGFFSLIYFALMLLLFFSFGQNMINRTDPETSLSQIYQPFPDQTLIGQDDYFFIFGLQDDTATHFIDNSIYNASLQQNDKNAANPIQIPIEPCTTAHLPSNPDLYNYFTNAAGPLENLWCIKKGLDHDQYMLYGMWDQPEFFSLFLSITPCINGTTTTVCKPQSEIDSALQSGFFAYYSTDFLFDMMNYENPAINYGLDYYIPTTISLQKIITRHIKTNFIKSDEGWIMNSPVQTKEYSHDYDVESFQLLDSVQEIVNMEIRKSTYVSIYSRNYKKIQTVFAEMTGFLQIIFIGLYIIANPFIRKEYHEALTNSIYNFEVDENEAEEEKKNKKGKQSKKSTKQNKKNEINAKKLSTLKTIIQAEQMADSELNSQSKIGSKKKREEDELVNHLFKLKETPLNMTLYEYLKSSIAKENDDLVTKRKQRSIGVQNLFSQLDIKYVLKKFAELEKLKMLLLDEDQYHLFEYLPKPTILKNTKIHINYVKTEKNISTSQSPVKKSEIIHHGGDLLSKARTVQRAYRNIKKKPVLSDVDTKLIDFLDQDILKILEEGELLKSETKLNYGFEQKKPPDFALEFKEKEFDSIVSEHTDNRGKEIDLKYSGRI